MGDLLSGIFDFLGSTVVAALEQFVIWLYQLIVVVFQVLLQLLSFVANFFAAVFHTVAGFLDSIWNKFFKGIFGKVWNALKAGQQWLESKLSPVIKFLQHLRQWLQRYYNIYVKPVLLMIQHIRQFLQILKALHISFAAKLDAWLAQLQARIVQSFATIIGTINTLTNVLNAIVDPLALLRKPALLLSIRRQIPALIHLATGRPPGYWFPSPRTGHGSPFTAPSLPFNFNDTAKNPPTSNYLAFDDGIAGVAQPGLDFQFADGAVDQAEPLDYFDDDLYPASPCTDPVECLVSVAKRAANDQS
jgi:hypothetical protein